MHLEIPEGANVQIIVGSSAPLAFADESRQERPAQTGGRPILKGLVVAIALVGTFVVGQHFGGRAAGTQTRRRFQCHGLRPQGNNTRSLTRHSPIRSRNRLPAACRQSSRTNCASRRP